MIDFTNIKVLGFIVWILIQSTEFKFQKTMAMLYLVTALKKPVIMLFLTEIKPREYFPIKEFLLLKTIQHIKLDFDSLLA